MADASRAGQKEVERRKRDGAVQRLRPVFRAGGIFGEEQRLLFGKIRSIIKKLLFFKR